MTTGGNTYLRRTLQENNIERTQIAFRSWKKFDNLCNRIFFSPDLFMKISNFSKTVHTNFIKFCTVILHPKGPLRAQRHQNPMTEMLET